MKMVSVSQGSRSGILSCWMKQNAGLARLTKKTTTVNARPRLTPTSSVMLTRRTTLTLLIANVTTWTRQTSGRKKFLKLRTHRTLRIMMDFDTCSDCLSPDKFACTLSVLTDEMEKEARFNRRFDCGDGRKRGWGHVWGTNQKVPPKTDGAASHSLARSQSTMIAAASPPQSSCQKWPARSRIWCGCPFAPGTRS